MMKITAKEAASQTGQDSTLHQLGYLRLLAITTI